ncbi:PAS domain S-box protein [Limimaricola sp. G21655-S1]|uniref:sensor histidine kinase n=1 Tax=Limimaricola sp. G21655-S1 TaxID=3014768 RepID=UPI0022AFF807|nr:GAF domain-containing protein [Limimaricola sp. G21655-S1]MCZ4260566.1 PAS domain S-box protein [Limimaricola sp. G21655-S1]
MQHLESLFDRALDAVVGMDDQGRITAWNGAAEAIFGWRRAEALGRLMGDVIVPPQHRDAHAKGLARYNRTGVGPVLETKVRITALHRSGREFPVELSIFPMQADDGTHCFYAFIRSLAAEEAHRREQELRAREADILLRVAQKLLEDISVEAFTRFCLDEVCSVAGLDAGHLFFVRGAGGQSVLLPSGIWHISDARFGPVVEASRACRFAIGEGLPGRAWQAGDLVVQRDLAADAHFARRRSFCEVGLTRGMALPIRQSGEVHAVLELYGTEASRFDAALLQLVRTVGTQVGIAIRRKQGAEQREMLRREVVHRVNNSLAVASSIFRSCARTAGSMEELSEAYLNRVQAIGQANRLSLEDARQGVPLDRLIREAVGLLPNANVLPITVPDLIIDSDCVMPLSLILNELATNGLKYGGLGTEADLAISGRVCVDPGDLCLTWQERLHVPHQSAPTPSERVGFGSQLLRSMVEGRLGGAFEREIDAAGFRFELRVPLGRICEGAIMSGETADPIS